MKICVIGTHGVGKTTLAYEIATEAKRQNKNAIVINEIARNCPFPLNEGFTLQGAIWIITSQINKELTAIAEKNEVIVCDRSSYDPICYLRLTNEHPKDYEKLENFAEEWMKTYEKIIFVTPSGLDIVNDGVRCINSDYQQAIHDEFSEFCRRHPKCIYMNASRIFSKDLQFLFTELFK